MEKGVARLLLFSYVFLMILQNRIIGKFQRDSLNLVRIFVAGRRNDCYTVYWNRAEER